MTKLPRLIISLPSDIEEAINKIKSEPENKHTPKSRIVCGLVRQALEMREQTRRDAEKY